LLPAQQIISSSFNLAELDGEEITPVMRSFLMNWKNARQKQGGLPPSRPREPSDPYKPPLFKCVPFVVGRAGKPAVEVPSFSQTIVSHPPLGLFLFHRRQGVTLAPAFPSRLRGAPRNLPPLSGSPGVGQHAKR
jgi:hypothetical protein